MATSTYSPSDALQLVQAYTHGMPVANVQANVCDVVNSMIWCYYPWGWSIASLTATNLVQGLGTATTTGNTQDYNLTGAWITVPINLNVAGVTNANWGGGFIIDLATATLPGLSEIGFSVTVRTPTIYPHNLPVGVGSTAIGQVSTITGATVAGYNTTLTITSVPNANTIVGTIATNGLATSGGPGFTNILRPLKSRIARLDSNPPEYRELVALGNLSPELSRTAGIDSMKAVGYFATSNVFRFDVSPQVSLGQIIQLQGEYQTTPTKITNTNLTAVFSFPDRYYNVFVEGLKWKLYQLSDDTRAGTTTYAKNGNTTRQYTGQLGTFMNMLIDMSRTEDLSAGDLFMFPESPLGASHSFWPGLYGL